MKDLSAMHAHTLKLTLNLPAGVAIPKEVLTQALHEAAERFRDDIGDNSHAVQTEGEMTLKGAFVDVSAPTQFDAMDQLRGELAKLGVSITDEQIKTLSDTGSLTINRGTDKETIGIVRGRVVH